MITLSLNFDGITGKARTSHEKKVRKLVDTHLGFPGSDKLKMGLTVKDNGYSAVTFAGPRDVISEAKRLWNENVQPTANKLQTKFKAAAKKATAEVKKSVAKVRKPRKVAVAKRKTVRVKAKVSVSKKKKR